MSPLMTLSLLSLLLCVAQLVECLPARREADTLKITPNNSTPYVQEVMRLSKAAEMRNLMNEQTDPCLNFYNFTCGNWNKINPANSVDHLTTGFFEVMSDALNRKIAFMLNDEEKLVNGTATDEKVKDFYKSCLKIRSWTREQYRTKLLQLIAEFGEMPAVSGDQWNEEGFDWLEVVGKIANKYGKNIIIGMDVLPDFMNNAENRLYFGYPEFALESRSMYVDDATAIYRQAYKLKISTELKHFLGVEPKLAKQAADQIVNFEMALAKGMLDEKLGLGIAEISVLTTVDELQQKYAPHLDMKKYIKLNLGEELNGTLYEYVEGFQTNLIKVLAQTPKSTIANYIYYTFLDDFQLELQKTEAKQEKFCIDNAKKYFAKNLDNMVYRKYNTNETARDVDLIWHELKAIFKAKLLSSKLNWIDLPTRRYAVEKLEAMKLEINSYANTNFSEEFDELVTNKVDYVENMKNILQLYSKQAKKQLHQPPKPLEAGEILSYTPANILLENAIRVPVSLLQPYYLWSPSYPNALKFGTLGTLVGHELIHGFDDNGRKFDKQGNTYDWWDSNSQMAFVDRTSCFSDQYSNYVYGGHTLPRSVSQSENIADNGGLKLAYEAYLKWHDEAVSSGYNLELETLPTLNYTSKQLFFISFAQVWCNDVHPAVRDMQTYTDEHVPGEYRVIGSISNFPEFAKVFQCKENADMNPAKKCEIY